MDGGEGEIAVVVGVVDGVVGVDVVAGIGVRVDVDRIRSCARLFECRVMLMYAVVPAKRFVDARALRHTWSG